MLTQGQNLRKCIPPKGWWVVGGGDDNGADEEDGDGGITDETEMLRERSEDVSVDTVYVQTYTRT